MYAKMVEGAAKMGKRAKEAGVKKFIHVRGDVVYRVASRTVRSVLCMRIAVPPSSFSVCHDS
jgi:hypothetical protein